MGWFSGSTVNMAAVLASAASTGKAAALTAVQSLVATVESLGSTNTTLQASVTELETQNSALRLNLESAKRDVAAILLRLEELGVPVSTEKPFFVGLPFISEDFSGPPRFTGLPKIFDK